MNEVFKDIRFNKVVRHPYRTKRVMYVFLVMERDEELHKFLATYHDKKSWPDNHELFEFDDGMFSILFSDGTMYIGSGIANF